jgi:glycosyltransferase involved in cell wall biosynthesis
MPTFHRPGYLREALASAVGQTYKNLQIIVRDNASGDETPEVVRSFDDPRIEFFQALHNEGPWRNGNECVRRAKGRYLLPLCDDDILGENYVATLAGFMEQDSEIIAAYGATHSIDENGLETGKCVPWGTHKWGVREIVQAWSGGKLPLISGINFMCLTSFFVGLGERISFPDGHNTDNAIFMTAGIRGKVLFTDQCVFYYRVHSLNSVRRHPCQLRAQGDREFLRYLDAEVKSRLNVNVSPQDWPKMRDELQAMLGNWYYGHFLNLRLDADSILEILKDATVYPTQAYGVRNAFKLLSRNRSSLRNEIRKRVWGFGLTRRMNTER